MKLGVFGCGKMAYAFIKGVSDQESPLFKLVLANDIDGQRLALFEQDFQARSVSADELVRESDIVLLAVKPGQIDAVLNNNRDMWHSGQLIVSIAAGIKTGRIEKTLNCDIPVVRIMPNTPALVGQGFSAICKGQYAESSHVELVKRICDCIGESVILEEKYMDAVTAVAGSGPAYSFLFVEAMIEAAVNVGLSADIARRMVVQTMKGSVTMMEKEDVHPAVLKSQVCSPAGTTIAAIKKLEESGFRGAVFNAIEKAYQRAIELGLE